MTPDRDHPICTQQAARAAGLDVAPTPAELTAMAELIVHAWGDQCAEPDDRVASAADAGAQLARALPLVLAEMSRMRSILEGFEADNDELQSKISAVEVENDDLRAEVIALEEDRDS